MHRSSITGTPTASGTTRATTPLPRHRSCRRTPMTLNGQRHVSHPLAHRSRWHLVLVLPVHQRTRRSRHPPHSMRTVLRSTLNSQYRPSFYHSDPREYWIDVARLPDCLVVFRDPLKLTRAPETLDPQAMKATFSRQDRMEMGIISTSCHCFVHVHIRVIVPIVI
jgi:hypothetical protein